MAKRVIAEIDPSKLKTLNTNTIRLELQCLKYPDNAIGETKGGFYVVGRKWINVFVATMLEEIAENEKYFSADSDSENDRDYFKSLLK